VGAVGHYLEREGIPTTQISLVREHTEVIRPPRALWVPFMMGRPLGAPDDPEFQRKVLLAALRLLEEPSGPVLRDFAEDAPSEDSTAPAEGEACPVNFSRPLVAGPSEHALAQALAEEIAQLEPWHDLAVKRRSGTTVGVSQRTPAEAGAFVVSFLSAHPARSGRAEEPVAQSLKYACDDLRAFYEEAASAQPGALSSVELEHWLYFGTVAGEVLRELQKVCLRSDDDQIRALAKLVLIPRAVVNEAKRTSVQTDEGR
jgi:hypothetical protein